MAALDPPGTGPARGAFQGGGAAGGRAGEFGAPRTPGRPPAAPRTGKEVAYPDTRTSGEQRAKHAPSPLRLRAPVTCAGERGGVGASEVPVPTSCAAPVAASAQVQGLREIRLLLSQVSGETESARRGGADINPGAAAPAHAPRSSAGAPLPRFRCTCPRPGSPALPRSPAPEGRAPRRPPSTATPEAALRRLHRVQLAGGGRCLRPRTAPRAPEAQTRQ